MDEKELTDVVSAVAGRYGFETATAEFCGFTDFKVQWTRTHRSIHLKVSDYLDEAPADVLAALTDSLLQRIKGDYPEPDEPLYPEVFSAYVTSKDFRELKTEIWAKRAGAGPADEMTLDLVREAMDDTGYDVKDLKVYGGKVKRVSTLFNAMVLPDGTSKREVTDALRDIEQGRKMFGMS